MIASKYYTLYGVFSLVCWALSAALILTVSALPTYQILFAVFVSSFVISSIVTTRNKSWHKLKTYPVYLWVTGVVCIFGNEVLYITSFKYAPAAQVDIINYLWPLLVILFSPLLPNEKLKMRNIFSVLIAFGGVFYMLQSRHDMSEISAQYLYGYIAAFGAALLWAIYTLVSKNYGRSTPELIGVYCGFCALLSGGVHLVTEEFIVPTTNEIISLIIMGGTTHSLAYVLWDKAVKKGNFQLLSVLSYANPILSVYVLFILGYAEPSASVWIAGICVVVASIMSVIPWQRLYDILLPDMYDNLSKEEQYEY